MATVTSRGEPVVATNRSGFRSKLPQPLCAVILVVLTLGLRSAAWSAIAPAYTIGLELRRISKKQDDLVHPIATFMFKAFITWFGWRLDYDYIDISALTLVANAPFVYLLTTFYDISYAAAGAIMVIEAFSIALPTYLLRPQSIIHDQNAPLRNRFLLNSLQVQTSASLLTIGVYGVVIWAAIKSGILTSFLVTHFVIPTLEIAHNENPLSIAWKTSVAGVAAKTFLLNPSIGAASGPVTPLQPFDPATATLPETVKTDVWFFNKRNRTLLRQTVILSAFLFANTIQRCMTLQDAEALGAVGYAGLWVLATVICAGWFAWVGDTEYDLE